MKIALIGASGNIGSKILAEAVSRGHDITAIARNSQKIAHAAHVTAVQGDVTQPEELAALLRGHDAVISSVHFSAFEPAALLGAIKASGVKRYLVVGGAGSLELPNGQRVVDSPDFPEVWRGEALLGAAFLGALRQETALDWTFLSPSALIAAGKRTGVFRLGKDALLVDADGKSHISEEDYAVAMLDEVEEPQHIRARFTAGY